MSNKTLKINDINFFLKNPTTKNTSYIYVSTYLPIGRLKMSTGIKIEPKYWDMNKQRIKRHKEQVMLNARLETIEVQIKEAVLYLMNNNKQVDAKSVKQKFDENYSNVKDSGEEFWIHFDNFIENYKFNGQRPGKSRIRRYSSAKKRLKDFEEYNGKKITFNSIDEDFYSAFLEYNYEEHNISDNTVSTYIKIIKTFMKWAFDKELHSNTNYLKFKTLEYDAHSYALSEDEIEKIENADLSDDIILDRARNHFLLQIYTGLRYNDMIKLNASHFNMEEGYIRLATGKTTKPVIIRISNKLKAILDKFPDFEFDFKHKNKQNERIKKVGKIAGIDQPVEKITQQRKRLQEETVKKYELMSTHTARRTFITLGISHNVNHQIIMKSSGHSSYKAFQKYVRLADKQVLDGFKGFFD